MQGEKFIQKLKTEAWEHDTLTHNDWESFIKTSHISNSRQAYQVISKHRQCDFLGQEYDNAESRGNIQAIKRQNCKS